MTATVTSLSDRLWWPVAQNEWGAGFAARLDASSAVEADEWRASMRRLARRLGTSCRTFIDPVTFRCSACANGGYPLGIIDPADRAAYLEAEDRRIAEAIDRRIRSEVPDYFDARH